MKTEITFEEGNTMITAEDVKGVADFIGRTLTQEQTDEVLKLYPGEQEEDPGAEWYLVVEKIVYDITS
jgi:hypothetical protein